MIVMTAISSAGWNGMAFIDDMDSGVMDRFLVSPVWRGALNLGSMAYSVLTIAVQSLIIVGLAYAVGAHFRNGVLGIAVARRGRLHCSAPPSPRSRTRSRSSPASARR